MTIHNLSTRALTPHDLTLLDKGLSFSPTPATPTKNIQAQILHDYNDFAKSIRLKYSRAQYTKQTHNNNYNPSVPPTMTSHLYRQMTFLPPQVQQTRITNYSGYTTLETYIDNTKQQVAEQLHQLSQQTRPNISTQQQNAIYKLRLTNTVTIKPADKNLGIVMMDTDDYITQCLKHLTDKNTYRLITTYPTEHIRKQLSQVLINFKQELNTRDKRLYKYLLPQTDKTRTPLFYGLPKIHKTFTDLPPLRPIVSQTNSLLSPTAKLIDYILQPIASSYPDYLHNSTALSLILQQTYIPDNAILVTIDVTSLYPSIPQQQCLNIIYNELHNHRDLLTFDPNLTIQLLHININNNCFTFNDFTFQQINGTAMGATFSPTIANIFMSTILRDFLQTQRIQPLLITRYIDDIFMIWTDSTDKLTTFLTNLNKFHPDIHFTYQHSPSSIDFLDMTIYKGHYFDYTNTLDTKTFQKPMNLYQYLHFHSDHQPSIFKAIIKGECIRYARTNTMPETYKATVHNLKKRLRKRQYPTSLIDKITATVKYNNRQKYLQNKKLKKQAPSPPLYKYIPPPQYKLLKQIVLHSYTQLHFTTPRFIALRHPNLQNQLVRARQILTDEHFIDTSLCLDPPHVSHIQPATLPPKHTTLINITPCRHPRCSTCHVHLNCNPTFKSNYPRNKTIYRIRHNFTCKSTNVIYLITCTKCKKQYVGYTTQQLNTRLNHHRTCIHNKKPTYIHKHFNLPDHAITNLTIQPIDTTTTDSKNVQQELLNKEIFWINTLRTLTSYGLNCI